MLPAPDPERLSLGTVTSQPPVFSKPAQVHLEHRQMMAGDSLQAKRLGRFRRTPLVAGAARRRGGRAERAAGGSKPSWSLPPFIRPLLPVGCHVIGPLFAYEEVRDPTTGAAILRIRQVRRTGWLYAR
jgi:hypothetical protein